jgi:capsid protein
VRDAQGYRTVCQVYNPTRVSQTRGHHRPARDLRRGGMFEDLNFAKLVQAQMVSLIAAFIESPGNVAFGARDTETASDGSTTTFESLAPGMILRLKPGEKLARSRPNVPNAEFFPHAKMLLQLIGLNLGLPLVLTLMDASETNFSGWRGAVDQARLGFRVNQQQLKRRLHCPVYQWKLRQWMREDPAIRAAAERSDVNILGHKWNSPKWPYIQPEIEAEADQKRKTYLLVSPRGLHAERGGDWDDVYRETVEDNRTATATCRRPCRLDPTPNSNASRPAPMPTASRSVPGPSPLKPTTRRPSATNWPCPP